jgi:hypothetical protein
MGKSTVWGLQHWLFIGGVVGVGDAEKGAAIAMYIGILLWIVAQVPLNLAILGILWLKRLPPTCRSGKFREVYMAFIHCSTFCLVTIVGILGGILVLAGNSYDRLPNTW